MSRPRRQPAGCFTADPVLAAALNVLAAALNVLAGVFTAVRCAELVTLAGQTFAQERALLLERY
jgi:hypothetical protein